MECHHPELSRQTLWMTDGNWAARHRSNQLQRTQVFKRLTSSHTSTSSHSHLVTLHTHTPGHTGVQMSQSSLLLLLRTYIHLVITASTANLHCADTVRKLRLICRRQLIWRYTTVPCWRQLCQRVGLKIAGDRICNILQQTLQPSTNCCREYAQCCK